MKSTLFFFHAFMNLWISYWSVHSHWTWGHQEVHGKCILLKKRMHGFKIFSCIKINLLFNIFFQKFLEVPLCFLGLPQQNTRQHKTEIYFTLPEVSGGWSPRSKCWQVWSWGLSPWLADGCSLTTPHKVTLNASASLVVWPMRTPVILE